MSWLWHLSLATTTLGGGGLIYFWWTRHDYMAVLVHVVAVVVGIVACFQLRAIKKQEERREQNESRP